MIDALSTDALLLHGYQPEWRLLRQQSCNVLLEGTATDTEEVLRRLRPHIREPIVSHQPPATLELPSTETGALIVNDATALNRDEQGRLLAWMDDMGSQTRIISTSPRSLFALVEAGRFDAALYYRLNVMLLRVTSPSQYFDSWREYEP